MSPVELSTRGTVEQTVWYSVTQWLFPDFSSPIILLSRFIICKADFLDPNIRSDFEAILYHTLSTSGVRTFLYHGSEAVPDGVVDWAQAECDVTSLDKSLITDPLLAGPEPRDKAGVTLL